MQTRAQQRSRIAHARILVAKGKPTEEKYRTSCRRMPQLLHQCGLLQAMVFMASRDETGQQYVSDLAVAVLGDGHDREQLLKRAQTARISEYLWLSDEVAEAAQWFRRFSQIELGDGE
jgi:CRISPR type III-B/RAMP module-associated protein Cmr5